MSRWRPPAEKSSPYITAEGEESLRRELGELWKLRRNDVLPALTAAAAEGDRSENAEYIYRKKQLGEIDRRVRYLSRRLDEVQVVHNQPADTGKVFFGAWITVDRDGEETRRYRIVGADEIDAAAGLISVDSPLARNMLGKTPGEVVTVRLPDGPAEFELIDIEYS